MSETHDVVLDALVAVLADESGSDNYRVRAGAITFLQAFRAKLPHLLSLKPMGCEMTWKNIQIERCSLLETLKCDILEEDVCFLQGLLDEYIFKGLEWGSLYDAAIIISSLKIFKGRYAQLSPLLNTAYANGRLKRRAAPEGGKL